MVARRPSYGYLLRAEFDRRIGATRPLNIGQVYKTLDALERDGLVVRSATTDADGHIFYEATEAGRGAVDRWLSSAEPTGSPARSDLAIKVAVAATLPGVDLDRLLAAQRRAALGNLQRLTREMAASAPADRTHGGRVAAESPVHRRRDPVRGGDPGALARPRRTAPPPGTPGRRSPRHPVRHGPAAARQTAEDGRKGPLVTEILKMSGIGRIYPGPQPVTALSGIDLEVGAGELITGHGTVRLRQVDSALPGRRARAADRGHGGGERHATSWSEVAPSSRGCAGSGSATCSSSTTSCRC